MDGVYVLEVKWKGKKFDVEISKTTTYQEFREKLSQLTEVQIPDQKLIAPKNIFKSIEQETLMHQLLIDSKVKSINLLGSSSTEKEQFKDMLSDGVEINKKIRFKEDRKLPALTPQRSRKRDKPEFGFGKFKPLDGFKDRSTAKKMLKKLGNDPGVLFVMKEFGWQVPVLSELYPEGEVGISEVCVLGLNVNNGQEIKLRIRTDDLKGFRKHQSMIKVLCHELAHNRFSEHDARFFAFMSEIEKKVKANNWKKGHGFRADGEQFSEYRMRMEEERNLSEFSDSSEEESQLPTVPFSGNGFRIASSNPEDKNLTRREKMAKAAEKRMQENKEKKKDF